MPLLGAIPEDQQVIVATNRGEPLVLQKKLTLSGIAYENAARRLIGKQARARARARARLACACMWVWCECGCGLGTRAGPRAGGGGGWWRPR